ncbi:hypothetical protein IAU60_005759 [Kwoniella sp. DSM 27419]
MPTISSDALRKVFGILAERETIRLTSGAGGFYSVQNSMKHRPDNRYSNVLAYDRTAVVVDGQYLNANKVEDGKGGVWIASQHAMEDLPMKVVSARHQEDISSTVRKLQLGDMTVHHYHFDAWPDHGVPEGSGVGALKGLVLEVEQKKKDLDCEVWVHCSAGVGRTGSYIALASLLTPGTASQPSALPPLPSSLEGDRVAKTVDCIRECRGMLVQNHEQLRLIYEMQ